MVVAQQEALGALLEVKRDQAKEIGHAVEFERNGVLFRISPNGAKGGFQYELVCPADDTRLLLRKPNAKPKVGVKVVFSAKTLALRGLPNALSKLKYATEALGLAYYEGNIDVCRFDVCTDILAPGFVLDSEHFVCHSRHGTRDFGLYSDTVERGYAAANLETVMIGRLPGREVTLYDKRLEIERRQSWGLEEIWNTCLREQRRPHLSSCDRKARPVWRVEVRAGADFLRKKGIRSLADLSRRYADYIDEAMTQVRMIVPSETDGKRDRWPLHPLWAKAKSSLLEALDLPAYWVSEFEINGKVREGKDACLYRQVLGCIRSLVRLHGIKTPDLAEFLGNLADRVLRDLIRESNGASKRGEQNCPSR